MIQGQSLKSNVSFGSSGSEKPKEKIGHFQRFKRLC